MRTTKILGVAFGLLVSLNAWAWGVNTPAAGPTGENVQDNGLHAIGAINNSGMFYIQQPGFTAVTLDAASEGAQWIMQASKTCSIQKIVIATATVTTGATMDWGVYQLDSTTGLSSGTVWATNTTGTMTIADANDNTYVTSGNLTATADVTVGQVFVVQLANPAASFGNMNINYVLANQGSGVSYSANNTGGSYTKGGNAPNVGVLCADGTSMYLAGTAPGAATNTITFSSASSPDEIGLVCTFNRPIKAAGIRHYIYTGGFAGNVTFKLYDADSNVLASYIQDKDNLGSTNRTADLLWTQGDITIMPGSPYRITATPDASNYILAGYTLPSAAYMSQFGGGATCYKTSRTDAGAWTDDATSANYLWLLVR